MIFQKTIDFEENLRMMQIAREDEGRGEVRGSFSLRNYDAMHPETNK